MSNDVCDLCTRAESGGSRSVDSLKRKLAKDSEVHRIDNMRIMQENVPLSQSASEAALRRRGVLVGLPFRAPKTMFAP